MHEYFYFKHFEIGVIKPPKRYTLSSVTHHPLSASLVSEVAADPPSCARSDDVAVAVLTVVDTPAVPTTAAVGSTHCVPARGPPQVTV